MRILDFILWLILPGNLGRIRSDEDWNETQGFVSALRLVSALAGALVVGATHVIGVEVLASHALVVDVLVFVGVLFVWTLAPGISSLRNRPASGRDRPRRR